LWANARFMLERDKTNREDLCAVGYVGTGDQGLRWESSRSFSHRRCAAEKKVRANPVKPSGGEKFEVRRERKGENRVNLPSHLFHNKKVEE